LSGTKRFFSKQNINKAIWALLIGLVSFVSGKVYQGIYGPQKVVIDSRATKSDPIYVRIHDNYGDKLNRETGKLKKDINESKMYSNYVGAKDNNINKSLSDKYELPKNVKGYYLSAISGITDNSRVDQAIKRGYPIIISFLLRDKNILSTATPAIVDIVKVVSSNEVTQVYKNAYELRYGQNNIVIDVDLPRGKYELRYGYYRVGELSREFPNFYSKVFEFKVLE